MNVARRSNRQAAKARFRSSQGGLGSYSDWRISMNKWSRVLLLAGVLTMTSLTVVAADPWQVDTCYILCDGGQYIVAGNSLGECCTGTYLCPDHTSPYGVEWSGGPGEFPTFCGPYED